jgi:TPR repeat protein
MRLDHHLRGFLCAVTACVVLGMPLAGYGGVKEGIDALTAKNYSAALREFRPASEQGDAVAQYFLGLMYAKAMASKSTSKKR